MSFSQPQTKFLGNPGLNVACTFFIPHTSQCSELLIFNRLIVEKPVTSISIIFNNWN